jgi:hypothetical protein
MKVTNVEKGVKFIDHNGDRCEVVDFIKSKETALGRTDIWACRNENGDKLMMADWAILGKEEI